MTPPTSKRLVRLSRKSLDESVREAAVIVVATAVDSAPAPPNVPGDGPEVFLRFRVARVLKGELAAVVVTTRTPTAAAEFLGRDWVVMLSPEHVAGKHFYGGCYTATVEPEVMAIVAAQSE